MKLSFQNETKLAASPVRHRRWDLGQLEFLDGIVSQSIVIVTIRVAACDSVDTLAEQIIELVHHFSGFTIIAEAGSLRGTAIPIPVRIARNVSS